MIEKIFGRHPVLEALKSGQAIEKVFLQHGTRGPLVDSIYKLAKQRGIPITQSDKEHFHKLAGSTPTQGVIALLSTATYVDVQDILSVAQKRNESPFILVLDEIEDPHNVGALIRTGECAGIHGVIIPKHHTAPLGPTVAKASAGAVSHVAIARVSNLVQAMDELKSHNIWLIGADVAGEKLYSDMDYSSPVAIVIGSEGKGIRRLVKEQCDFLCRIPMHGKIGSLNASVAGGLLLFEAARQRNSPSAKQ